MGFAMAVLDAATVLAAWAAGYAIATFALDPPGSVGIRQTMYLNAFVAVEIARNVIRLVLRPETGSLRLIPMPDAGARYLATRLIVAAAILGYGQLLAAPIVARNAGWQAGQAVGVAVGSCSNRGPRAAACSRARGVLAAPTARTASNAARCAALSNVMLSGCVRLRALDIER